MIDIEKFMRDGWVIVDMDDPILPPIEYNYIDNDLEHRLVHEQLTQAFWNRSYALRISSCLRSSIWPLLGFDVMVQYMPYLRIARPGKPQDNIGYHKDTQYGQTPYELAVHIPFVDLDEKSAIRVISGSHLMSESAFKRVTADGPLIEKGSMENHMGRPYMPKCLAVPEGMQTTPLAMKVGQAAIFSPAIFHGQEVNEGDITRVSCDLRFVSARAPVDIRKGKVHAGYVPISQSPVEMLAEKYYLNQKG